MFGRRKTDLVGQRGAHELPADAEIGRWKAPTSRIETIVAVIGAIIGVAGFLGLRIATPLESRVTKLEQRQDLDSYILCMMVRRTDPLSLPPDCAPIEAAYARRGVPPGGP